MESRERPKSSGCALCLSQWTTQILTVFTTLRYSHLKRANVRDHPPQITFCFMKQVEEIQGSYKDSLAYQHIEISQKLLSFLLRIVQLLPCE